MGISIVQENNTNKYEIKLIFVIILSIFLVVLTYSFPPIPQDTEYHNFADKRELLSIPNFCDVMGNIAFLIFGLMGIQYLCSNCKNWNKIFYYEFEKFLWKFFFVSICLVTFGSVYYHLLPNNESLMWDRLPMTLGFMSFFIITIIERINYKAGTILFPIFLSIGVFSVLYWSYTESFGEGDLRLYALVQFLPIIVIPFMLFLFNSPYSETKKLINVVIWYLIAKILEHFDYDIFDITFQFVSGHTLKHIAAAFSVYYMLIYLKKRKKIM